MSADDVAALSLRMDRLEHEMREMKAQRQREMDEMEPRVKGIVVPILKEEMPPILAAELAKQATRIRNLILWLMPLIMAVFALLTKLNG